MVDYAFCRIPSARLFHLTGKWMVFGESRRLLSPPAGDWEIGGVMAGLTAIVVGFLVSLVLALLSLVILWYADRYEKEPVRLVTLAFGGGLIVAPLLAWLLELAFGVPRTLAPLLLDRFPLTGPNYTGAAIDELAKWVVLLAVTWRWRDELDDALDGLVYGGVIGAGYALAQASVYYVQLLGIASVVRLDIGTIWALALSGMLNCVFTGVAGALIGYGAGLLGGRGGQLGGALVGLVVAVLYHLGWVAVVRQGVPGPAALSAALITLLTWAGLLFLVGVVLWALQHERAVIRWALAEEVQRGVLSETELRQLLTGGHRLGGGERAKLAVELAFAKWRLAQGRATPETVTVLREELQTRKAEGGAA